MSDEARPHAPLIDALVNLDGGWYAAAQASVKNIQEIDDAAALAYRLYSLVQVEQHRRQGWINEAKGDE